MERKTIRVVLLTAVVLGGVVAWWLMPHEPSYNGTSLSGWLRELEHDKVERRLMAAEALRHIGPKAVPFLVARLQASPSTERSRPSRWKLRLLDWLSAHTSINISPWRNPNARHQAMAALDALGPDAKEALPALEKLVERNPPDPQALYVIARIGGPGVPFLKKSLTNSVSQESKVIRLQARVCLEMINSKSLTLYPAPSSSPDSDYMRRICEFNVKTLRASFSDYKAQHPEMNAADFLTNRPPASLPPDFKLTPTKP